MVIATAILSHFILDAITQNPDLDLFGNGVYKIGLGLWNYQFISYTIEAILLFTGLWIYLKSTISKGFGGKYGIPTLSLVLLIVNLVITFGPPPTNIEYFSITMLVVYIFPIIVSFWVDQKRN